MHGISSCRCGTFILAVAAAVVAGCGGGGGGTATSLGSSSSGSGTTGTAGTGSGSSGAGGTSTDSSYVPGQYLAQSQYANRCAAPRTGTDPVTGVAYPDVQGTSTDENNFLRSWTHDLYLWYSQVPDLDPSQYTTANYFPLLKTSATTASGAAVDRFHFTYSTAYWESFSQQGVVPEYGVDFEVLSASPPRNVVVAYVEPNAPSPATTLGRGATVQAIDGVSINDDTTSGVNTLNAGLAPAAVGESHVFTIQDYGSTTTHDVTLTAANVTETPVMLTEQVPSTNVGYILFNSHIATAESELVSAINQLQTAGVTDLVLDMRYNGGGLLDIASEAAYMVAGAAQTTGHTFELQQFNDQHPSVNPVTGSAITPTLFHSTTQGLSLTAGQPLPSLNLTRLFVLSTAATCSASESVINGLQGINVQVILVGGTTCGKPYGFYPQDNCGTTYFSIQFRGVNDQGFGDYPAGFTPNGTTGIDTGVVIPGCPVADDFSHALGDPAEALLSAAVTYSQTGACPVPSGLAPHATVKRQQQPGLSLIGRPRVRQIRILRSL